jgi:hypothetical protein
MASYSPLYPSGYSLLTDNPPLDYKLNQVINRQLNRELKEVLNTLIGAASGTANASYSRVTAQTGSGQFTEGKRSIESKEVINTSVGATEATDIKNRIVNGSIDSNAYVADTSGNGGAAYS